MNLSLCDERPQLVRESVGRMNSGQAFVVV